MNATDSVMAPEPDEGRRHTRAEQRYVLVVDDSADMRALLREVLEYAGYRVETVGSGDRAMALMRQRAPDLVISDLLMPGMTGFSLRARMLRDESLASIPVIVLSAYWRRPSETLEASAVLTKPINVDRLLDTVGQLLRADPADPP